MSVFLHTHTHYYTRCVCVCVCADCALICLHLYEVLNYPQDARKTANADVSCLFVVCTLCCCCCCCRLLQQLFPVVCRTLVSCSHSPSPFPLASTVCRLCSALNELSFSWLPQCHFGLHFSSQLTLSWLWRSKPRPLHTPTPHSLLPPLSCTHSHCVVISLERFRFGFNLVASSFGLPRNLSLCISYSWFAAMFLYLSLSSSHYLCLYQSLPLLSLCLSVACCWYLRQEIKLQGLSRERFRR